jgi:hypothetical protein
MTLTALITLNVVLGATVVYALVHLLAHGVHSDRRRHDALVRALPERVAEDRLAA